MKMRAIILAAGSSTRLGKHTKTLPKGLLEINGKTILQRQIELYKKNGIDDIIIITGPNSDAFNFKNVTYTPDKNHEEHDVLCSLMAARHFLNTDLIMSYSDILFDEEILKKMLDFDGLIGISVDMNWKSAYENRTEHPITEADNVLINNGKIIHTKKFIPYLEDSGEIGEFSALMRLSSEGAKIFVETFERLEKTHTGKFHEMPSLKKAVLTDMLQELLDSGITVSPIFIHGKWCEIDTLQDLEFARKVFF